MRKNEELNNAALSRIAISAIFVGSFIFAGSQFSQQGLAIHEGAVIGTTTLTQSQIAGGGDNATTAQNQTGGGPAPATTETAMQEPTLNRPFTWQGTLSSSPIEGVEEEEQSAVILPPRRDGGVYTGWLTFSSSKPIQVEVWHEYNPENTTAIPEVFGTEQIIPFGGKEYARSLIEPATEGALSATVPFAGNALALTGEEEFIGTYSVSAASTQPRIFNNIESTTTVAAEEEAEGEEEDEGAATDEDEDIAGGVDTGPEGGVDTGPEGGVG
jgi:hypothetical protein